MSKHLYSIKKFKPFFPENYDFPLVDFYSVCPYTFDELMNKTRLREIVQWRQILSLFLYAREKSSVLVGEIMGKDHATILYSLGVVMNALHGRDQMVKDKIDLILHVFELQYIPTDDICMNEILSLQLQQKEFNTKFATIHCAKCE